VSQSEGAEQLKEGAGIHAGTNTTEHDSLGPASESVWTRTFPLMILRYRAWPAIVEFFFSRFEDHEGEDRYRKEGWFLGKSLLNLSMSSVTILKTLRSRIMEFPLPRPQLGKLLRLSDSTKY
jgi:hypothetical protein